MACMLPTCLSVPTSTERHVNIQAIVEEHYERYFDQEEEYMKKATDIYKKHYCNYLLNIIIL